MGPSRGLETRCRRILLSQLNYYLTGPASTLLLPEETRRASLSLGFSENTSGPETMPAWTGFWGSASWLPQDPVVELVSAPADFLPTVEPPKPGLAGEVVSSPARSRPGLAGDLVSAPADFWPTTPTSGFALGLLDSASSASCVKMNGNHRWW